ncbi:MAG: NUDIX hydrolase [Betaproteobacteria bacterium]|nr:NUDIX hydrolase [Betaproteobacteria bacterium]
MRDFTERTLDSKLVYDGKLLEVREDNVSLPDGQTALREYIVHPGAVIILPMLDEHTVLVERQFRYPLHQHFLELPAGKIDPGEAHAVTARRELLEETGYEALEWTHLFTAYPCVGYSNEKLEFYLAQHLRYVGHPGEEGEFLETVALPVDQALSLLESGEITEAKTIMGLLWIDRRLRVGR